MSRQRILERLGSEALVLDVGGGASPLPRADWVIDLLPYERRGLYGDVPDPATERFSAERWVTRDICARQPWPFAEGQFDFAVCSHTLEDVRDPVFVCAELQRVARAGYIEVPSRLEEQSWGVQGPWAGWSHHRWLVDVEDEGLTFVGKPAVLHGRPSARFDAAFHAGLRPEQRVSVLWWERAFCCREQVFLDAAELDAYLEGPMATQPSGHSGSAPPGLGRRLRRALAAFRTGA